MLSFQEENFTENCLCTLGSIKHPDLAQRNCNIWGIKASGRCMLRCAIAWSNLCRFPWRLFRGFPSLWNKGAASLSPRKSPRNSCTLSPCLWAHVSPPDAKDWSAMPHSSPPPSSRFLEWLEDPCQCRSKRDAGLLAFSSCPRTHWWLGLSVLPIRKDEGKQQDSTRFHFATFSVQREPPMCKQSPPREAPQTFQGDKQIDCKSFCLTIRAPRRSCAS